MVVNPDTIDDMFFDVLHNQIVVAGPPPKIIYFMAADDTVLCEMPFDDIEGEPGVRGTYYFKDSNDLKILRALVSYTSIKTVTKFAIKDVSSNDIITGIVTEIGGSGDITFNTVDWEPDQVVIISQLRIIFPSGA